MTDMYAVVSRPGPVEASILSELSPTFSVQRRPAENVTLRCLETTLQTKQTEQTKQAQETQRAELADASTERRPPVVLLHGRGHAATIWLPLLPEIARQRRVLALDLPGFGHSSSPPFRSGDAEEGLRFFIEPVEALLREQKLEDAILIGHSLGGLIALELALRGAVTPRKLVLIGCMGLGPAMTALSRAFFLAGPERIARLFGPRILGRISPHPDTPLGRRLAALEHELYAIREGRAAPAAAFNSLFPPAGPAFHRQDRLAEVDCPTLLLWGERDAVFPPSVAREAASRMRNATLRIEPLGHAPHLEAPERVLPALMSFLR